MLETRRPDPNAALTWIAVWLFALVALALMPVETSKVDFAAVSSQLEYSNGNVNAGTTINLPVLKNQG